MEFKILKKEPLYHGFFRLNRYTLSTQLFEGGWSQEYSRELFERGDAAAILLYDAARELIILVEQFRAGAALSQQSPWLMELVAGMIESNESPESVARREAEEEAGCSVGRLTKICDYWVSPGGTTEKIWLFLGEIDSDNLPEYAGLEDENEDIKVHKVPIKQAFEWIADGKVNNAMSIIALQWLQLKLLSKSTLWR